MSRIRVCSHKQRVAFCVLRTATLFLCLSRFEDLQGSLAMQKGDYSVCIDFVTSHLHRLD